MYSCSTSYVVCYAAIVDQRFLRLASTMLFMLVLFLAPNNFVLALFLVMTRRLEIALLKEPISSSPCAVLVDLALTVLVFSSVSDFWKDLTCSASISANRRALSVEAREMRVDARRMASGSGVLLLSNWSSCSSRTASQTLRLMASRARFVARVRWCSRPRPHI